MVQVDRWAGLENILLAIKMTGPMTKCHRPCPWHKARRNRALSERVNVELLAFFSAPARKCFH